MAIYLTEEFRATADDAGIDVQILVDEFSWWKEDEAREYLSPWFGKDSAYTAPRVNGEQWVLRHCHLPPSHTAALARWQKILSRKGRKTSDRVLVYVKRPDGDFLLIFVLDEPGAHQIAKMENLADRQLMQAMSAAAEEFLAGDHSNCRVA
ncbi:type II toxin-antitoxin system YafO family toxin [Lysobacter sp. GCM10012299]|uniref:type II toxin-antitoxin system YafO family toxin n=1 Tax=Lysobacter sp. GCM10012299 TaxID=3317333 RepID=UPI003620DA6F